VKVAPTYTHGHVFSVEAAFSRPSTVVGHLKVVPTYANGHVSYVRPPSGGLPLLSVTDDVVSLDERYARICRDPGVDALRSARSYVQRRL